MILRFLASVQDAWIRFRDRKYRARTPRIAYADAAVRAAKYRKYRRRVLAVVLAWMLARKIGGAR